MDIHRVAVPIQPLFSKYFPGSEEKEQKKTITVQK